MKIAIPIAQKKVSLHFGHCDEFAIFDIDEEKNEVVDRSSGIPPVHAPGVLPRWLHEQGVDVIIAGGMGMRAQQLFQQNNIEVVVGAKPSMTAENIVHEYLNNTLVTGENICDH